MKLSVALCFAGIFGALAAVFILLSCGTDYWLLGSETCKPDNEESKDSDGMTIKLFADVPNDKSFKTRSFHCGLFWCCYYGVNLESDYNQTWVQWFSHITPSKVCYAAYVDPFAVTGPSNNTTNDDSAIIYRGFWSVFMLISVVTVAVGGFLIICAAPFASHRLYKAGGGLFLTSGFFLLCVVVMHVVWVQVLDVVQTYTKDKRSFYCPDFTLTLSYSLSFLFAPIGIFFSLLAGLLFLLIGRTVQRHT